MNDDDDDAMSVVYAGQSLVGDEEDIRQETRRNQRQRFCRQRHSVTSRRSTAMGFSRGNNTMNYQLI